MLSSGTFILEFANKLNLKAIIRYLLGRQEWSPFTMEPVEFAELNFDFHPKAVRNYLRKAGFEIQRQLTVSHFRVDLLKRALPIQLLVAMDSIAQLTGAWWQLTPSVFIKSIAVGDDPARPHAHNRIFICPVCQQDLPEETNDSLKCVGCGKVWPVRNGIYDFREV
jgi:hypothetical protein